MNQSYLRNNHAWNAVRINGNCRLVDATWAAGGVAESDEDNIVFYKNFKEVYYFTSPDKLILNHLPAKKQFQLANKIMDQTKFMKAPLYLTDYLANSILSVLPDTALIRAKMGDTLVFKFKTNNNIQVINAFSERIEKAVYAKATIYKDGWLEFHYPVKVIGTYNLYLENFITNQERYPLIVYRIEVN